MDILKAIGGLVVLWLTFGRPELPGGTANRGITIEYPMGCRIDECGCAWDGCKRLPVKYIKIRGVVHEIHYREEADDR
jgi:hypothetical protein